MDHYPFIQFVNKTKLVSNDKYINHLILKKDFVALPNIFRQIANLRMFDECHEQYHFIASLNENTFGNYNQNFIAMRSNAGYIFWIYTIALQINESTNQIMNFELLKQLYWDTSKLFFYKYFFSLPSQRFINTKLLYMIGFEIVNETLPV